MNNSLNRRALRSRYGGKPSGGNAIRRARGLEDEEALSKTSISPMRRMAVLAIASSKVNQWTLLVGTVPLVFNLASYVIGKSIPARLLLDKIQRDDLLLTSAQSAFAVAMLLGLHLSLWEAGLLTALFLIQFLIPETHTAVTGAYLVLSAFFIILNRAHIADAIRSLGGTASARTARR